MQQQKKSKETITACDVMHFSNVVERTCTLGKMPKETYLFIFFETGCKAVEGFYKDEEIRKRILSSKEIGFWNWFMVEYIKHDDDLHNSKVPYRNYEGCKKMWLDTYKLYDALTNFIKYKLIY